MNNANQGECPKGSVLDGMGEPGYLPQTIFFLESTLPKLLACLDAQLRFLLDLQARQSTSAEAAGTLRQLQELDLDYLTDGLPKAIWQIIEGLGRVTAIVSAMKDFAYSGEGGKTQANLNKAIEIIAFPTNS